MASVQIHIIYKVKKHWGFCKLIDEGHENNQLILINIFILLQVLVNIQ